jgi:hypothetical protein
VVLIVVPFTPEPGKRATVTILTSFRQEGTFKNLLPQDTPRRFVRAGNLQQTIPLGQLLQLI